MAFAAKPTIACGCSAMIHRPGNSACASAGSITREIRALAVTIYFAVAAALYLCDSVHLALIMLQLNVLEGLLALRIKALNDSIAKSVQGMLGAQMDFAMLVRGLLVVDLSIL
jgi:hypothetical protein